MKTALIIVIAGLWALYASQKDRSPMPQWYHPATHFFYAALLLVVILWL